MAIEEGIVTNLNAAAGRESTAWVKIVRTGACESCSSRHSCDVGKGGGQSQEVEAVNEVKARIGDRIQVAMNTGSLIKATFLLYLFPILCMILGGLAGQWISMRLHVQGSIWSVLFSLAFLAVAMLVVRVKGRQMGMNKAYRPRILRVIGRATATSISPAHGAAPSKKNNDGCASPDPYPTT